MIIKTIYRPIYERNYADGTREEVDHTEISFLTYERALEHGNNVCSKANGPWSTNRVKYVAVFPVYGNTEEDES